MKFSGLNDVFLLDSTEVHQAEGEDKPTRELEAKNQTIHQFFNHFFFPAFEHHQLVTKTMIEDKLPATATAQQIKVIIIFMN